MTDAERIAELQAAVTQLQGIVGVARYMSERLGVEEWTAAKNAAPLLPSGDRNVSDRMREIGISQDDIVAWRKSMLKSILPAYIERIEIVEAENEQLRARIAALEARPIGGGSASGPVLPLVPALPGDVAEPMMRDTVSAVLGDGEFDVTPARVFDGATQINGEVGLGGPPIKGYALALRTGGEIAYLDTVPEQDTQEGRGAPGSGPRRRAMVVSMNPYDNGFRLVRGGLWIDGMLRRVQDVIDIFGFDSSGWVSKSTEDYSKPQVEKCQDWIIKPGIDEEGPYYELVVCRAGYGARISASSQTTNYLNDPNDGEPNFNRSAKIIASLPGAMP